MLGRDIRQARFDNVMLLVGDPVRSSIYRLLAEHGYALFGDERDSRIGRPVTAWRLTCGGRPPLVWRWARRPFTPLRMRNRLRKSDRPQRLFDEC